MEESYEERLKKEMAAGDLESQVMLADMYLHGDSYQNVAVNEPEGLRLLEDAIQKGSAEAMYLYGLHLGRPESMRWIRKASMNGCADATAYLAECYLEGNGVEKDWEMARYLASKADDQGYYVAAEDLVYPMGLAAYHGYDAEKCKALELEALEAE